MAGEHDDTFGTAENEWPVKGPIRRIGFVGAGPIARAHAVAAKALGAEITGAATTRRNSPNLELFSEIEPRVDYHESVRSLFDDGAIEGVVVCLPWRDQCHWRHIVRECDKPLLLEKPTSLSIYSAKRDIEQNGLKDTLVGFNRRFYGPVQQLRTRIRKGGLKEATVVISEWLDHHIRTSGHDVTQVLLEYTSIHTLDLMLHLFGHLAVEYVDRFQDRKGFNCYSGILSAGIDRTKPIHFSINCDDPSPIGIWCKFSDHTMWALSPLEKLTVYQGIKITDGPIRKFEPRMIEQRQVDYIGKPGFLGQMKAFLSGDYGPGASLQDSLNALELLESIRNEDL